MWDAAKVSGPQLDMALTQALHIVILMPVFKTETCLEMHICQTFGRNVHTACFMLLCFKIFLKLGSVTI